MKKLFVVSLFTAFGFFCGTASYADSIELSKPAPETSEARVIRLEETEKAEQKLREAVKPTPEEERKAGKIAARRQRERGTFDTDANSALTVPSKSD